MHVSRALKMHGKFHAENLPEDEYDCCAEIAIESYREFLSHEDKKNNRHKDKVVSSLLN